MHKPIRELSRLAFYAGMLVLLFALPVRVISAESPTVSVATSGEGFLDNFARSLSPHLRELDAEWESLRKQLEQLPRPANGPTSDSAGFHARVSHEENETKWVQVDLGQELEIDAIALVPAHVVFGSHPGPGYGFPKRFRIEVSNNPDFTEVKSIAEHTSQDFPNPGDIPVLIETPKLKTRLIRVTATRLWPRGDFWIFALGELVVLSGNRNIAINKTVTARDSIESPPLWESSYVVDGQSILGPPVEHEKSRSNGYHSREFEKNPEAINWVQIDLGATMPLEEIRLVPARPLDFADILGFGFPVRFRVEASDDPEFASPAMIFDHTEADFHNPGDNPVVIPAEGFKGRFVRVTATRLWERTSDYAFALGEMQVFSGGTNAALKQPVSARESHEGFLWAKTNLVDGCNSQHRLADLAPWLRKLASRRDVQASLQRVEAERTVLAGHVLGRSARYAGTGGILLAVLVASLAYRNRLLRALELERLRSRIAADLHDELGARLTGITLAAEAVERKMADSDVKKPEVMQLSTMAREVVRSIDEIVWAVNPRNDTLEDLADYLFHFTEEFFQHSGIRCRLDLPADLPNIKLETGVRHNLFLCVKEALHNLLKHSKATEARVRLQLEANHLRIVVEDDGRGFEPTQTRPHGNGLKNLRSRMEAIGGTVEIQSRPGKGTRVSFDLRLTRSR